MPTIAPFPHRYSATLSDGFLSAEPRPRIAAGAPPQFGGTDDVWSPEELLVGSALLCLKTTFDAYARRDSLEVLEWRGTGTGVLEKSSQGPVFTSIQLKVEMKVRPGSEQRAQALLETAEGHCIISKALNAPVKLEATVSAASVDEPKWTPEARLVDEDVAVLRQNSTWATPRSTR